MPHYVYRARKDAILIAAIHKGLGPNATDIARAIGLNRNTFMDMMAGRRNASAATLAAVTAYFGGEIEDYFELVPNVVPAEQSRP